MKRRSIVRRDLPHLTDPIVYRDGSPLGMAFVHGSRPQRYGILAKINHQENRSVRRFA